MLLVFDFDGTLVDSIRDLAESATELSREYGGQRLDDSTVSRMVGEGARILVDRILAAANVSEPHPDAYDRFLQIYDRRMLNHTAPYPGMADMLAVAAKSHGLAMLTNKPALATQRIMSYTGLDRFFRDCVFGDGPFPRKPDPAGLRWLMGRHRAKPGTTVLIGDSDIDLATARAAGVRPCVARYGFGFLRMDPSAIHDGDLVIDQPADLLDVLPDC